VHIDSQGSSTCRNHTFWIPPPLIVVEKMWRFYLNKSARLIVVHKHNLRGNQLKARVLLCMCIITSFSCDDQHFLWWMLQVDPPECKILLTDPPLNPTRNREKTVCLLVLWLISMAGFVVLLCSLWEEFYICSQLCHGSINVCTELDFTSSVKRTH
jgi:hypothetical protein